MGAEQAAQHTDIDLKKIGAVIVRSQRQVIAYVGHRLCQRSLFAQDNHGRERVQRGQQQAAQPVTALRHNTTRDVLKISESSCCCCYLKTSSWGVASIVQPGVK